MSLPKIILPAIALLGLSQVSFASNLHGIIAIGPTRCPAGNLVVEIDPLKGSPQAKVVTNTSVDGTFNASIMDGRYLIQIFDGSTKVHHEEVELVGQLDLQIRLAVHSSAKLEGCPIYVDSRKLWTDSGIQIVGEQTVMFEAIGSIRWSKNLKDVAGPEGSLTKLRAREASFLGQYPVKKMGVGGLIARVGSGAPFAVGSTATINIPARVSGRLYFGINDNDVNDNDGNFWVVVVVKSP